MSARTMNSPALRMFRGRRNRHFRCHGVNIVSARDGERLYVKVACTDGAAWLSAAEVRELADEMEARG